MAKFARVTIQGRAVWAVEHEGQLRSLESVLPDADDLSGVMQAAAGGLTAEVMGGAPMLDASAIEWLQPVPRPGKVICLGLNYAAHAAEGGNAAPEYPAFFMRGTTSLISHLAPLVRPRVSDKLDYEAELAVIIGRRARHLTEEDALQAVLGYTCFNDGSVRDYQRRSSQWTIGKNFDGTGAIGPWLVSAADLPPGAAGLKIQSRLNGQVMQSDSTSNMIISTVHALVLLSECLTLEPGDVIAMGTPSGVGYPRKPPVFMKPGDRIEIEIERVGLLANTVVAEADA
jgi:2-keto-4-pentenoate hydratase/2-oxohepta-3-ene-1,7-dioic acid hydratase in catechol pathway